MIPLCPTKHKIYTLNLSTLCVFKISVEIGNFNKRLHSFIIKIIWPGIGKRRTTSSLSPSAVRAVERRRAIQRMHTWSLLQA